MGGLEKPLCAVFPWFFTYPLLHEDKSTARMNIGIPNSGLVYAPKYMFEHVSGKSDYYAKGAAFLPGGWDTAG